MKPLFDLNSLRSNISAHHQSRGETLIDEVKKNYCSLEIHFKSLIKSCDQTMQELRKILK